MARRFLAQQYHEDRRFLQARIGAADAGHGHLAFGSRIQVCTSRLAAAGSALIFSASSFFNALACFASSLPAGRSMPPSAPPRAEPGREGMDQLCGNLFEGGDRMLLHRPQHQRIDKQKQQRDSDITQQRRPRAEAATGICPALPGAAGASIGAVWNERFSTASRSPR